MKFILAIDQGTTGSRAVVYDRAGRIAASAYREFPQYFPRPGWVEHDAEEIWASVESSIRKVLEKIPPASIAAIGITNQRETAVLWDRNTGRPVHRAIVWQCRRTAARCAQINKNKALARSIAKSTGLPVDAYFSATKIEWLLKNVPGAAKKAADGELLFGTTDSWLLWKLTRGRVHATDHTNASRTMLFDIGRRKWDARLMKLFGVPASILPAVLPSSGEFGRTAAAAGLPAGIPVTGMAGDQQAALFGQACFEPGTVKNTYGTGCFLLMNTGAKRVVSRGGLITTLACGGRGQPVYALEGSVFIAGAAIQWLRDGLKLLGSAADSEELAAGLKDNEGVYLVPAFTGLGAPYWKPEARGALFGLTRGTSRAHFARAAIEAMCYQTQDVLGVMERDSGIKLRELKIDGGAAANDLLCRFQADISRLKVVRPRVIETTSLGAAYLAGLAVGYWKGPAEIKACWAADKTFKPALPSGEAARLYCGWRNSVRRVLL
ncbi:MAG: glycerol kinase [Elusimicrobia bacterium RIFOXYB2_FULL_62_6]|nr:MAG: glycerol kinase [Elusimicrobia bacterium RIFOXYB2_FULL_62_6]